MESVATAVKLDLPFVLVFLVNLVITREFVTCVDHFPVNRHFVVEHVTGGEKTQLPEVSRGNNVSELDNPYPVIDLQIRPWM